MLLMTGNTRSGGVSQGRPKVAAPAVGAQRRALTDAGAEGIRPPTLKRFVLLWFPFGNFKVAGKEPARPAFPLAT
jgi:hypothetical protein